MKIDPEKLGYLVLGHAKRLGRMKEADIPQLGEAIAALAQPFAQVAHFQHLRA
jgi:heptaprenylglyceryl phosphate synthase